MTLLRLSTKLAISMSTRFFEHLLRLPIAFFGQRYAGLIVTRVQTNDELASLLSSQLAAAMLGLVTAVLYLGLIAIYAWSLALVALIFAVGNVVALRYVARRQRDANRLLVQDLGKLTATAASGLSDIETLKATSQEDTFFARFVGQQARAVSSAQTLGAPSAALASVPVLLGGLSAAGVLAVGAWQVMDGTLSLGMLAAVQVLVVGFNAPLALLVGFGSTCSRRRATSPASTMSSTTRSTSRRGRPRRRNEPGAHGSRARSSFPPLRSGTHRFNRRCSTSSGCGSSPGSGSRLSARPGVASRRWRESPPVCTARGRAGCCSMDGRERRSPRT